MAKNRSFGTFKQIVALVLWGFRSSATIRGLAPKHHNGLKKIGDGRGYVGPTPGLLTLPRVAFSLFFVVHPLPTFERRADHYHKTSTCPLNPVVRRHSPIAISP